MTTWSADHLHEHTEALRRLARTLIRNPAEADDVVQTTWVRALQSQDRPDRGQGLRFWLLRVLRSSSQAAAATTPLRRRS